MRGTDGRTTVTLEIEDETTADATRTFEIESIVQSENTWVLLDGDDVPRLMLTPDEFAEIGETLSGNGDNGDN